MTDPESFDRAVAPVRDLVQADGGDLVVEAVGAADARLRLILDDAECRECVMPRQFLEQVALDIVQRELPTLTSITIDDPREAEGA